MVIVAELVAGQLLFKFGQRELVFTVPSFFFWQKPVCCFHVTLNCRIDFYIRGSKYNIFVIKTF
jgi:hypothetical protein